METLGSIGLGIGLSAACGFRVFVPLLITSIMGMTGWLPVSLEGTRWIATWPALLTFATATLLEILGYLIPWLDHLLDSIATPAAVVAGVLVSASTMVDLPPLLRWAIALIGGGGIAGAIQGVTVLARAKSTTVTGGAANHVLAIGELAGSIVTSIGAILFPVVALVLIVIGVFVLYRIRRRFRLRHERSRISHNYH
ncbi:DUF4126 domain-containing protein [bacterium]|nr:MAG: DUF4126 domain-containing protein [bacterium]